jgi:hypothetical protein
MTEVKEDDVEVLALDEQTHAESLIDVASIAKLGHGE